MIATLSREYPPMRHPQARIKAVDHNEKPTPAAMMLREAAGLMLSGDQKSRLRHADRLFRGSRRDREEAEAVMRRLSRELNAGIEESVALERMRGGEVSVSASGAVHLYDRDGLHKLLIGGHLSPDQYDAGRSVREGFEARTADVGSQMGATEGGAEHNNDQFVFTRLQRAKKLQALGRILNAVAVECRDDPASMQMLKWVAGEGNSLGTFGGGAAYERNLKSLIKALDVAANVGR